MRTCSTWVDKAFASRLRAKGTASKTCRYIGTRTSARESMSLASRCITFLFRFPARPGMRLQSVLHKNGAIEFSYYQLAAKDGIIGLYPLIPEQAEKPLTTLSAPKHSSAAAHLDVQKLKISIVGGLLLKVAFEMAGPVLPA